MCIYHNLDPDRAIFIFIGQLDIDKSLTKLSRFAIFPAWGGVVSGSCAVEEAASRCVF